MQPRKQSPRRNDQELPGEMPALMKEPVGETSRSETLRTPRRLRRLEKSPPRTVVHKSSDRLDKGDGANYSALGNKKAWSSSIEVGFVPDGNAETSYPFTLSSISDPITNHVTHAAGMDREARVLQYKEKKKNWKFEKTIRYTSRKAYAETRPRVKGRFAKRTDSEAEIDGIISFVSDNLIAGAGYGIFPTSF
ncbi:zinc finger protein CONSTANS-LIKE 5-like [Salvia splendens]|uniref:zinc finger protein CONSTANS-LIKE 5-like n=1 Tax=Salvia splendens TaxID=180675 RepID=UPI001C27281E|nr:zinc finger protein CONSTANS-LIKE 5-like [Salvia splendens]